MFRDDRDVSPSFIRTKTIAISTLLVMASMAFYALAESRAERLTVKSDEVEHHLSACINPPDQKIKLHAYRESRCSMDALP
ncbi:hypothetical protein HP532_15935 [Pseudomonas sp. CrR25]|nr:hypothetical protein [Pseudomonas sp. CrR25]